MSSWTQERVLLAHRLYVEERKSASEVAARLGDTSRDSVLGLARRRGWVGGHQGRPRGEQVEPKAPSLASTNWPPERVAKLKELWALGKTGAEIADALNEGWSLSKHVSRPAVIGKAWRLRLPGRDRPSALAMDRAPRAPRVQQPTRPLDMRRPPKSGGGNRPALAHGNLPNAPTTPEQTDAIRAEKQAEGRKVLAGFTAANDDAIPLVGRPRGTCGWPVGEPERMADQLCCGASVKVGSPYCAGHTAMATAPMTKWGKDMERSVRRYL